MALESGTLIVDLDPSWPLGGDNPNKGDDHLRLMKNILQTAFPGVDGNGFKKAITATEDEINFLSGLDSSPQDQIDALDSRIDGLEGVLSAEQGTVMPFYQAAAPTGWTQITTIDDHVMRVVDGVGGGSGGSDSPINFTHEHATAEHVLTEAEMPAHTHTGAVDTFASTGQSASGTPNKIYSQDTGSTGGNAPHGHGNTGSASWTPKYIDMIIASKD